MDNLDRLSKKQLLALLQKQDRDLASRDRTIEELGAETRYLRELVEKFQRLAFGQKRERFEGGKEQLSLPFEAAEEEKQEQREVFEQKIEYVRKKKPTAHKGRVALPDHLPVEEVEIHPEGDLEEMVCIGKEVTEELDYVPAKYIIRRYIRYKYAPKDRYSAKGVLIGELPERVIDKGIPGAGLLASIMVDKYVDHLPLYRQKQRFARENIPIASSTIEGWAKQTMERLEILYGCLLEDTRSMGYLQVDETTIKVMDGNKKNACHLGYYWVYHNPLEQTVLFQYRPTRGGKGPEAILEGFKGYLQSDGYKVYEKYAQQEGVTHLACWAHARRKFFEAKQNDGKRSDTALGYIQELYGTEAEIREKNLDAEACKKLRLEKSLPVINAMAKWLKEEVSKVLPKSAIAKAMYYSMERWAELSNYLYDGKLKIDNNPVENAIRPVALGRKNYLFAGSHSGAQRAAMIYSFFAICKNHQVNPYEWLKHVLENIMSTNHRNIRSLYPQNYKKNM